MEADDEPEPEALACLAGAVFSGCRGVTFELCGSSCRCTPLPPALLLLLPSLASGNESSSLLFCGDCCGSRKREEPNGEAPPNVDWDVDDEDDDCKRDEDKAFTEVGRGGRGDEELLLIEITLFAGDGSGAEARAERFAGGENGTC